jgi:hypothetical protein
MACSKRRLGMTAVAVGAAFVSMAGGAGGAAAMPRSGAAPAVTRVFSVGSIGLDSTALKLKDSHGRKLYLTVFSGKRSVGTVSVSIELSTNPHFGSGESHTWSFQVKRSALSYNARTGRGVLNTGKALKSFGSLKLSFAKTSQSTGNCVPSDPSAGKEIRVKGHLSGKVFFNTQSGKHGWGTVGSHRHRTTFHAPDYLNELGSTCPAGFGGGSTACIRGLVWSSPFAESKGGGTSVGGIVTKVGSHTTSTISFSRSVTIHKPVKATRFDSLVATEPVPTIHGGTLTITTKGHAITGSALITSTSSSPNNYSCKSAGRSHTEKTDGHYNASWLGHHLTGNFTATGKATTPATGSTASYTTESF